MKERKYTIISVVSVLVALLAWQLFIGTFELVSTMIIPSPYMVIEAFIFKLTSPNPDTGTLFQHIWASLQVALAGFAIGVVVGVPLGIAMGWYRKFDLFIKPVFDLLRPIPPIAWIPLMVLWLGIGIQAKAVIIFFSAFIPCVINAYSGIKQTSPVHIWVAQTFGASNFNILKKVAIPTALPSIFTGMRISLMLAWTSLVAAELLAATRGLGFMIQAARMMARTDIIIVGMFVIGGIGAALAYLLAVIERRYVKGRGN